MDMTGVYACLCEAVCDVAIVPSHLNETRFDWERLVFAKYRIFSMWDPILTFGFFFANANKGGNSSYFLQSRILKKVLELDFPPIQWFQ